MTVYCCVVGVARVLGTRLRLALVFVEYELDGVVVEYAATRVPCLLVRARLLLLNLN